MISPIVSGTYSFECTLCGDCCSGNMKIPLNLYDLYTLSSHLGYNNTSRMFEEKVLVWTEGQNGALQPFIRYKTSPAVFCPFLVNCIEESGEYKGRCSLHQSGAKPLVCRLSPLGRMKDLDTGEESWVLIPPTEQCEGIKCSKRQSLMGQVDSLEQERIWEDRFFRILQKIEEHALGKMDIYGHLYHFNVTLPFSQIINNIENRIEFLIRTPSGQTEYGASRQGAAKE